MMKKIKTQCNTTKDMEEFLKTLIRLFSKKDWRGHKRKLFFSTILYSFTDAEDNCEGIINYHDAFSYELVCHDMASNIPYYPFEKESSFEIQEHFNLYSKQDYKRIVVTIKRNNSFWKSLTGKGCYTITVEGYSPYKETKKVSKEINYLEQSPGNQGDFQRQIHEIKYGISHVY